MCARPSSMSIYVISGLFGRLHCTSTLWRSIAEFPRGNRPIVKLTICTYTDSRKIIYSSNLFPKSYFQITFSLLGQGKSESFRHTRSHSCWVKSFKCSLSSYSSISCESSKEIVSLYVGLKVLCLFETRARDFDGLHFHSCPRISVSIYAIVSIYLNEEESTCPDE